MRSKKNYIAICSLVGLALLVLGSAYFFYIQREEYPRMNHTVAVTDVGFSPDPMTVSVGDTVTWVNESVKEMWPASNLHPTHSLYPGTGIWRCGASEGSSLFDSCLPIPAGKNYSFTFTHKGEWTYHDHLFPNKRGTIHVQ